MTQFVGGSGAAGANNGTVTLPLPKNAQGAVLANAGDQVVALVCSNSAITGTGGLALEGLAGFTLKESQKIGTSSEAQVWQSPGLTQAQINAGSITLTQPGITTSRLAGLLYVIRGLESDGDFVEAISWQLQTVMTSTHRAPALPAQSKGGRVLRGVVSRNVTSNTVNYINTAFTPAADETLRAEAYSGSLGGNTLALSDSGADVSSGFVAPFKDWVAAQPSNVAVGLTIYLAGGSAAAPPIVGPMVETVARRVYLPSSGDTSVVWSIISGAEQVVGGAGGLDTTATKHVLLHTLKYLMNPITLRAVLSNASGSTTAEFTIPADNLVEEYVVSTSTQAG